MAKINGTEVRVFFGVVAEATRVLYATTASITLDQNLFPTTNKDSAGWEEHGNGMRKWSGTISGLWDTAGTGITPDELKSYIINRTASALLTFATVGTSSTAIAGFKGNATFQNVTVDGPMEDGVKWSATFVGNGPYSVL